MTPWTRSDSLRLYLSGAAGDGGAQADPALSLGHYRSSAPAGSATFIPPDLAGVQVLFVSQACGPGAGALAAADPDSLAWAAPGDDAGPAVTVASGQTVLLESAAGPDTFVLVTRTAPDPLVGHATVQLLEHFNEAVGQANASLPAPSKTYRCLFLKNGPTQIVRGLKIWLAAADNPVRIALETPGSQPAGFVQTIASETAAPAGLSFAAPVSSIDVNVLTVALLRPNEQVGLWIERDVHAAAATPQAQTAIAWSYQAVG